MIRRRALATLLAVAAIAIALAGCGGSNSAKSALDDALGYMPKGTPIVIVVKTDFGDQQYKNLNSLLDRFPFVGALKNQLKNRITFGARHIPYSEIKPLLGNDIVVGLTKAGGHQHGIVIAWKTKDAGKAKSLLSQGAHEIGTSHGATLYQGPGTLVDALEGPIVIAAKTRALVEAALAERGQSDRLTQSRFESALTGLPGDAIVRVYGDVQKLLASRPQALGALRVPWIAAVHTFGATATAATDGIALDFRAPTQGVSADQLPLAAGSASPAVVRRPGEIAIGLRDPGQTARFAEQALLAATPGAALAKTAASQTLGVDLDRDVIGQLGASSAYSLGLDGTFVGRVDLKNPGAFKKTLAKLAKNLPKIGKLVGASVLPKVKAGPKGFYQVTTKRLKLFVGVVAKELVVASDPARAKQFATQAATPVAGVHGAVVVIAEPRSIVQKLIGNRAGAFRGLLGAFLAPLKDLRGWVDAEPSGLTGHLKLTIAGP